MHELVRFLRGQPTAVANLLRAHADDGHGCCRACGIGGRGFHTWPCTLYSAARAAAGPRPPRR
jgi:hypothetical protein